MNPKPYNGGQWTKARFHSFIVSALRSASQKWGPKWRCIDATFVRNGKSPKTGRPCKLHRCSECGGLFVKGDMRADHIIPVVDPNTGFTNWDDFVERMFVECEGFQALCVGCHRVKSAEERVVRDLAKRRSAGNVSVRRRVRRMQHPQGITGRVKKD
jgi:hypothetical protein